MGRPGVGGQMAEDGRGVAGREEGDRKDDERERERGTENDSARSKDLGKREERPGDQRPSTDVVDERRAPVQPPIPLVGEKSDSRNDKRKRHRQPPVLTS